MVGEHDRWEQVNVYSGTGSPGQSQVKGRKTAVAIVVILCGYLL